MIVVADEVSDLQLKIAGQIIVFEQNAVLKGLMPTLDLALGLGVHGRTTGVIHASVTQPGCQFNRDLKLKSARRCSGYLTCEC
jgi:hypothetical protein